MLLSAPNAAPEAELKCHLPEAQASLGGLWGPPSPGFPWPGQDRPGSFLPSFLGSVSSEVPSSLL